MDVREKLVEIIQNSVGGCARHWAEVIADGLIARGVTVQEWILVDESELRNYIGVPVCINRKTDGECWWAIIRGIKGDKVSTDYGGYFLLSEYGKVWSVNCCNLPQPPKGE